MTTVACKSDQSAGSLGNLIRVLEGVEDPRIPCRRLHSLEKILLIALFAIAGGALSWRQIREFGRLHQGWFALHVDVSTGIPCHDTFRRVFGLLLPEATQRLLKGFFENKGVTFDSDCYLIDIGRLHDGGCWFARCDEANSLCTIREEKRTNPAPLRRGMADKGGGNLGRRLESPWVRS